MKKKTFIKLVCVLALFVLFVACDSRGDDDPTMDISAADSFVYNEAGYNEVLFEIQLDGPSSKLYERKILVDYNDRFGNFIGTGSSEYMITDENGFADGRFAAYDTTGVVNIKFTLEDWPSEHEDFDIEVLDMPKIDSLVATSDTLLADGNSSTSIQAYISCDNDYMNGHNVLFTSTAGNLQYESVATDEDGVAYNNFFAPNQVGTVTITAKLEIDPSRYKTVRIACINRK